jgi:xylulokinase
MDLLATGSAHAWLAGLLAGGDQAALAKLADEADPETAPLFLPYLLPGEHGARWDPGLAGTLSGLHLGTAPATSPAACATASWRRAGTASRCLRPRPAEARS